jgi:hypothetical protein
VGLLDRFRRGRPPADALAWLDAGERVTAWGRTSDGGALVATQRGLWAAGERLGWDEVHKARWDSGVLTVVPSFEVEPGVREDGAPRRYEVTEPFGLPEEVRSRVTRSVAYSAHHRVGDGGVRIVARRVPGRDGLSWAVRYDPGTSRDPEYDRQVAGLLDAARAETAPSPDL